MFIKLHQAQEMWTLQTEVLLYTHTMCTRYEAASGK